MNINTTPNEKQYNDCAAQYTSYLLIIGHEQPKEFKKIQKQYVCSLHGSSLSPLILNS